MITLLPLRELLQDKTGEAAPELVVPGANGDLRCLACGHRCVVKVGREGICKVRFNRDGELRVPYGYVSGLQVDPIEKKPFFHAFPGRDALSFGMLGCDLHCSYCQNWVTSQALRDPRATSRPAFCSPEILVEHAVRQHTPVLVSTYNEPLITSEWAVDIFKEAKSHGLFCGYVSNGNATPEVLEYLRPYVDLYKVDLKGFQESHYRELGGQLRNVLETIRLLKKLDFWVEIVTLIVPGFNDQADDLRRMADFLVGVDPDMPWHVTAFHPDYKLTDPPPTTVETLLTAREFGLSAGLRYVYAGNLPGIVGDAEDTNCPSCHKAVIRRRGFNVVQMNLHGHCCGSCGAPVAGFWNGPSGGERDAHWPVASRGAMKS